MIDISIQKHISVGETDGKLVTDGDALGVIPRESGAVTESDAAVKSSLGGRLRVTPRAIDNAAKIIISS